MTVISDTKRLLADCQRTEEEMIDLISFHTCRQDIESAQYLIVRAKEEIAELNEMKHTVKANCHSSQVPLYANPLRRMVHRLEAMILYTKNHFKFD